MENILPLRDALSMANRYYDNLGSDYSVTELITPPRIIRLRKRYGHLAPDQPLEKMIASSFGTAVHDKLEWWLRQYNNINPDAGYLLERRLWDRILDRKISGKFDCYKDRILYDWKTTSGWSIAFGGKKDWELQLNIYAYLLSLYDIPVDELRIIGIYLDWDKFAAKNNAQYPDQKITEIPVPCWKLQEQKDYLYERIQLQKDAEDVADDQLPECTPEDMWEKASKWAVYKVIRGKIGNKAYRVFDTKEDCEYLINNVANSKPSSFKIVERPGTRIRCADYCRINGWCTQWKEYNAPKKQAA